MKKLLLLIITTIMFISISVIGYSINLSNDVECINVYTASNNNYIENCSIKKVLGVYKYSLNNYDINQIYKDFDDIISVEFTYKGLSIDEVEERLSGRILSYERIGNVLIYYLYSKEIEGSLYVNGSYTNIQVAITKEYVKVGIPMLVGEY